MLLSFTAVLAAGYGLFFTSLLIVENIQVTTDYKDIKTELVEKDLGELVIGQNTLFISTSTIEDELYQSFPEISSVACSRNIFRKTLSCNAIGYELVAVIKHDGKRYYINENGVIIAFDSRKLGLPTLDLILNPVFSNDKGVVLTDPIKKTTISPPVLDPQPPSISDLSPSAAIIKKRSEGILFDAPDTQTALDPSTIAVSQPDLPLEPLPDEGKLLTFIQPDQDFLLQAQSIVTEPKRNPFQVREGKKILDAEELKTILQSINQFETEFKRKVTKVQYIQVAGELSLKSKAMLTDQSSAEQASTTDQAATPTPVESNSSAPPPTQENPDHELEILLDLNGNIDKQFKKLKKARQVINFAETTRIDLSIEGKKLFYR